MTKLKGRNKKMKERIKNLLLTIEEYDKLASKSRSLIGELSLMQRELAAAEFESEKYQGQNAELNSKVAELKRKIMAKKAEVESTTVKLEKFKDDLSAEYSVIRSLQEQIEEKENALNELEKEHDAKLGAELTEKEQVHFWVQFLKSVDFCSFFEGFGCLEMVKMLKNA